MDFLRCSDVLLGDPQGIWNLIFQIVVGILIAIASFLVKSEYFIWYKFEKPGEFFQAVCRISCEPKSGMKMESYIRGQTPEGSGC
jgi:hypothetical protein